MSIMKKIVDLKYNAIYAKGYTPNWSRELFIVNKINDTVPYTYHLKNLNDEEIIGRLSSNNIKVELDLTNYATKTDLNNITHVDTSSFASKTNLAALKTEVDKLDIDKLKTAPTDLAKLTNAVENDLVKKTVYNTKVTNIEGQIAGLIKIQ